MKFKSTQKKQNHLYSLNCLHVIPQHQQAGTTEFMMQDVLLHPMLCF